MLTSLDEPRDSRPAGCNSRREMSLPVPQCTLRRLNQVHFGGPQARKPVRHPISFNLSIIRGSWTKACSFSRHSWNLSSLRVHGVTTRGSGRLGQLLLSRHRRRGKAPSMLNLGVYLHGTSYALTCLIHAANLLFSAVTFMLEAMLMQGHCSPPNRRRQSSIAAPQVSTFAVHS